MGSAPQFITKRVKSPANKNPITGEPSALDSTFTEQPLAGRPDPLAPPLDTPPASMATTSSSTRSTGGLSASSVRQPDLQIPENNMARNVSPNTGSYVPDPAGKPAIEYPVQPAVNAPLNATVNATGSTDVAGLNQKKKFGLVRSRFLSSSGLFRTLSNGPQGVTGGADGLLTPSASAGSRPTLG